MLKLKNITTLEKEPLLKNLNFHIPKGSLFLLNYKSQLEKDKLVNLICQIESPKSGEISLCGTKVSLLNKRDTSIYTNLGVSFQEFKFIKTKDVLGNITFPLEKFTKYSEGKIEETGKIFLKAFGLLEKKDKPIFTLSLEEKQKLNIARAIVSSPNLIILDEPTKHIKEKEILSLINFFKDLTKKGKTILILSNNKIVNENINNKYILEEGVLSNG